MQSYIWGRYKNQGNTWRYSNVTVFGNNYTVRKGRKEIIRNKNLLKAGIRFTVANDLKGHSQLAHMRIRYQPAWQASEGRSRGKTSA